MAIFIAALEALIRIPHDSVWYDVTMITLIVGATVGAIWAGYKMSRHSREVRVYRQVQATAPFNVWPKVLQPKNLPQWMTKLATYLLPIPKKEK
jgi:hypothetical protein